MKIIDILNFINKIKILNLFKKFYIFIKYNL